MDFKRLFDKAKKLLLAPQDAWQEIKTTRGTVPDLLKEYAVYIAAIPALAALLRYGVIGVAVPLQGLVRVSFLDAILIAVVRWGVNLLSLYLMAWLVTQLALYFDAKSDFSSAWKLVVYSVTPFWLVQIFTLVPLLGFLKIFGVYAVYLFYLGTLKILEIEEERAFVFTFCCFFLALIIAGLMGLFVSQFVTLPAYARFS